MDERTCESCSTPFVTSIANKRFCSERCRKRAEEQRRSGRRRLDRSSEDREQQDRIPTDICRDCGTTDGMGWWLGKPGYSRSGSNKATTVTSAATRCRPCYNAYYRDLRWRKQGARHGPPKPKYMPVPDAVCSDCGESYRRKNINQRCPQCSASRRTVAEQRRRAVVKRGDQSITWRTVGERDRWCCHLCGKKVPQHAGCAKSSDGATVDHLIPISDGGEHVWQNVRLAHRSCNLSRSTGGTVQLLLVG